MIRPTFRESPPDRPASPWGAFREWLAGSKPTDHIALAGVTYDPGDIRSRDDVGKVLGLTVREFVGSVLLDNEGRVEQGAFAEYTDWSAPQVSRVLTGLEGDGAIARLRRGREKIVCFPRRGDTPGQESR